MSFSNITLFSSEKLGNSSASKCLIVLHLEYTSKVFSNTSLEKSSGNSLLLVANEVKLISYDIEKEVKLFKRKVSEISNVIDFIQINTIILICLIILL